jgi:hypothetical protein
MASIVLYMRSLLLVESCDLHPSNQQIHLNHWVMHPVAHRHLLHTEVSTYIGQQIHFGEGDS